ncbi:uncharacterized protein LOC143919562 [Arctopsyche grandis]|uniref:uncharacterized protein LOC143919562 n=1 Tax=Arctopsyche grandis TaxID=121162 RepID=UPI00406D9126
MIAKSGILFIGIIFSYLACIHAATFSISKSSLVESRNECTQTGFMCDDCTTSAFCIELPNGDFVKEVVESCSTGSTCLAQTGKCTTESNYECGVDDIGYQIKCHKQSGIFPNPFSCKKFFTCVNIPNSDQYDIFHDECATGYAFDPLTTRCTLKVENNECPNSIPTCQNSSQSGAIEGNPAIYYMCWPRQLVDGSTIYFPELFYCQNNYIYNVTKCIDPTPPSGLDNNGLCVDKGLFYYPGDCIKYKDCSATGKPPIIRTCANHYKFDNKLNKCVLFTCNNM